MAGRQDYEYRKQAKIDRLENAISNTRNKSNLAMERSNNLVGNIPLGQPNINGALTGVMNKSHNAINSSIELSNTADYLETKLNAINNNNAISSDDPDSINKLQIKIDTLTKRKEFYKTINTYYRKNGTCKGCANVTDENAEILNKNAKFCLNNNQPFASFELTSLNTKIKIAQKRIKQLQQIETMPNEIFKYDNFCEIESNAETNRITIKFYKMVDDDLITKLKQNGFKWAYTENKWQRLRTPFTLKIAKYLIKIENGEVAKEEKEKQELTPIPDDQLPF